MSIKSTYIVRRSNAIDMLKERRITIFEDDCMERIEHELNEAIDLETNEKFENYCVVFDDYQLTNYDRERCGWYEV